MAQNTQPTFRPRRPDNSNFFPNALPQQEASQGVKYTPPQTSSVPNSSGGRQSPAGDWTGAFNEAFDRTASQVKQTGEILQDRLLTKDAFEKTADLNKRISELPAGAALEAAQAGLAQAQEESAKNPHDMVLENAARNARHNVTTMGIKLLADKQRVLGEYQMAAQVNPKFGEIAGKMSKKHLEEFTIFKAQADEMAQTQSEQTAFSDKVAARNEAEVKRFAPEYTKRDNAGNLVDLTVEQQQELQNRIRSLPSLHLVPEAQREKEVASLMQSVMDYRAATDTIPDKRGRQLSDIGAREENATARANIAAGAREPRNAKKIKELGDTAAQFEKDAAHAKGWSFDKKNDVYFDPATNADVPVAEVQKLRAQAHNDAARQLGFETDSGAESTPGGQQPPPKDDATSARLHAKIDSSDGTPEEKAAAHADLDAKLGRTGGPEQAPTAGAEAPSADKELEPRAKSAEIVQRARDELAKGTSREYVEKWMADQGVHPSRLRDAPESGVEWQRPARPGKGSTQGRASNPQAGDWDFLGSTGERGKGQAKSTSSETPSPASPVSSRTQGSREVSRIVTQAAQRHDVPVDLAFAVMRAESGGRVAAVSKEGATGLFQLMPDTAKDLGVDPHDPEQNADGGLRYLAQLLKRYDGDVRYALAAYNWGMGNLKEHGFENAPKETRNYIAKIMKDYGSKDRKAIA